MVPCHPAARHSAAVYPHGLVHDADLEQLPGLLSPVREPAGLCEVLLV